MLEVDRSPVQPADFDTLADSPIVAGNPAIHEFTVDGSVQRQHLRDLFTGGPG